MNKDAQQIDPNQPDAYSGPYSATDYGQDGYGHAINAMGRCAAMNPPPGGTGIGCPTRLERLAYLTSLEFETLIAVAIDRNITDITLLGTIHVHLALPLSLPPLATEGLVRAALYPLILTSEGY